MNRFVLVNTIYHDGGSKSTLGSGTEIRDGITGRSLFFASSLSSCLCLKLGAIYTDGLFSKQFINVFHALGYCAA